MLGKLGGIASGKVRKKKAKKGPAAKIRKPTAKPGGPHKSKKAYTRKGKGQLKLF